MDQTPSKPVAQTTKAGEEFIRAPLDKYTPPYATMGLPGLGKANTENLQTFLNIFYTMKRFIGRNPKGQVRYINLAFIGERLFEQNDLLQHVNFFSMIQQPAKCILFLISTIGIQIVKDFSV